ncbi:unnamed protein product [Durusdinium trenchii]|uniref:WW domain-containing protein n=2 Tax=Durusdinium trenchii TaxID=1381693 RepID=A0ABP0PK30_9DINO
MPTVPFGGTSSKPASSDEKIAARAFCGALLWPPSVDRIEQFADQAPAVIPGPLATALRRRRAEVLAFRCFLLLLRAKEDSSFQDAYTSVLLRLRSFGFVVRDSALLKDEVASISRLLVLVQPPGPLSLVQLAAVIKELDTMQVAVRLQPHLPLQQFLDDEDTRQLCIRHWCQSHVECCRFFPHFFQSHTRLVVLPAVSADEVEKLCSNVLLHGFAVLAIAHPVTDKVLKTDAALLLRGIGLVPAMEDGQASGSSCSLGFPPGSKSFRSVSAAIEAKGLPSSLLSVLGPPPIPVKPKAVTPAIVKKTGTVPPLVPIAPLPPPLPTAAKADGASFAPLLPAVPWPSPRAPPPAPKEEQVKKADMSHIATGSPEDWIEFRDFRTAKAYFYNPVTKDSSWTRPLPKPPPPPPAPPGKPSQEVSLLKAGLIPGTKDPEDWTH